MQKKSKKEEVLRNTKRSCCLQFFPYNTGYLYIEIRRSGPFQEKLEIFYKFRELLVIFQISNSFVQNTGSKANKTTCYRSVKAMLQKTRGLLIEYKASSNINARIVQRFPNKRERYLHTIWPSDRTQKARSLLTEYQNTHSYQPYQILSIEDKRLSMSKEPVSLL